MPGENTNGFSTRLPAVPFEAPPAYEPPKHADNVDVEQHGVLHKQPSPTKFTWKRLLLTLLLALFSIWFTILVLNALSTPRYRVVYSDWYSKDYHFRPAASPAITETLVDGRTRIRGAQPTLR